MKPLRNVIAGTVIALALFVAPPMAAADEVTVHVEDVPEGPDLDELQPFLAEKCTETLQLVQPGRQCYIE